jgi:hypothetical protein
MGPRYVLQFIFSEKSEMVNNSTATEAREKSRDRFGIFRILENV